MIITLPPRKKRLTALVAALLVLPLMLGLPATVTATSTCEAPYQYKGKLNELTSDDSDFTAGSARYIVNPTYPHTPCAPLYYYFTPVMGQVCPQRT